MNIGNYLQEWIDFVLEQIQEISDFIEPFLNIRELLETVILPVVSFVVTFIVLRLFITNRSLARKLNKSASKQTADMMERVYPSDSAEQNSNAIGPEILPDFVSDDGAKICLRKKSYIRIILNNRKHINFFIGEGGSGKSTLLMYLAQYFCHPKQSRQKIVVQLFPSYKLNELLENDETQTLLDLIKREIIEASSNTTGIIDSSRKNARIKNLFAANSWADFEKARKKRNHYNFRLLLLIDGYNELNRNAQKKISKELNEINAKTNGSVIVIMTSRYAPAILRNVRVHYAQELTQKQISSYLNKRNVVANNICQELLNTPILLAMYCKTYPLNQSLSDNDFLPIHNIESAADIYWNYMCSHMHNYHYDDNCSLQAVYLFYVLPYVAMKLEGKNVSSFSHTEFEKYVQEFKKNRTLFRDRLTRTKFDNVINNFGCWDEDEIESKCSDMLDFLVNGISVIVNTGAKDYPYRFRHDLYRNFYAAVYRYQRDISTLFENTEPGHDDLRYIYSEEEKLPDISPVIRKFYYQLIADHFRCNLTDNERANLSKSSVRYNCLLSDLHYYGDAQNSNYADIKQEYSKDKDKALEYAKVAINIGSERINGLEPSERNKKTDMTLLCWVRWSATHIIVVDLENQALYPEAYNYSKENCDALGYGEFIGFDKLAQMMTSKNSKTKQPILTEEQIDAEISNIPDKDKNGTVRSRGEKIRCKVLEYLKKGEDRNYHYSFAKHANLMEQDARAILSQTQSLADPLFMSKIEEAFDNYCKTHLHRCENFHNVGRIIFYHICYDSFVSELENKYKIKIYDLIEQSENIISDQLQVLAVSEITGYGNFYENAGFWNLMNMLSANVPPSIESTIDKINNIASGSFNFDTSVEWFDETAATKAEAYYWKLIEAFKFATKKEDKEILYKSIVAYLFVIYVCNKTDLFATDNTKIKECNRLFECHKNEIAEKLINAAPNKFFRSDRYATIAQAIFSRKGGQ